jgi:hypothetical protein
MLSEYNQQALATAYHWGWLNDEQYGSAVSGLDAMPQLAAVDFLREQAFLTPEQAEGLRQALDAHLPPSQPSPPLPSTPSPRPWGRPRPMATPSRPRWRRVRRTRFPPGACPIRRQEPSKPPTSPTAWTSTICSSSASRQGLPMSISASVPPPSCAATARFSPSTPARRRSRRRTPRR